jgi:hypothetical protein
VVQFLPRWSFMIGSGQRIRTRRSLEPGDSATREPTSHVTQLPIPLD